MSGPPAPFGAGAPGAPEVPLGAVALSLAAAGESAGGVASWCWPASMKPPAGRRRAPGSRSRARTFVSSAFSRRMRTPSAMLSISSLVSAARLAPRRGLVVHLSGDGLQGVGEPTQHLLKLLLLFLQHPDLRHQLLVRLVCRRRRRRGGQDHERQRRNRRPCPWCHTSFPRPRTSIMLVRCRRNAEP